MEESDRGWGGGGVSLPSVMLTVYMDNFFFYFLRRSPSLSYFKFDGGGRFVFLVVCGPSFIYVTYFLKVFCTCSVFKLVEVVYVPKKHLNDT